MNGNPYEVGILRDVKENWPTVSPPPTAEERKRLKIEQEKYLEEYESQLPLLVPYDDAYIQLAKIGHGTFG